MTLPEVFFLVAVAAAFWLMAFTLASIAKPSSRKEMGIHLPEDDSD
jgi:hypothetical protein